MYSPVLFSLFINELALDIIYNGRHGVSLSSDFVQLVFHLTFQHCLSNHYPTTTKTAAYVTPKVICFQSNVCYVFVVEVFVLFCFCLFCFFVGGGGGGGGGEGDFLS